MPKVSIANDNLHHIIASEGGSKLIVNEHILSGSQKSKQYELMKRVSDVTLALVGLVVASPVYLTLTVLIWTKLGKPVIFEQVRLGREGHPFLLRKFRTMLQVDES